MSNLVIVESPAKAKTIEKYLGTGYKVMATVGHIIDLPTNKIAVDVENGYKPEFVVMEGKTKVISGLKKMLPKGKDDEVFLAMDPDREGEAIAYHTASALKLKNPKRITFHEITKEAIQNAIKSPTIINQDLVQAQIARRVLDRLVGYKVSQLLWKKMWYGLSAGRVQSVALKLIVEREKEILAFVPEEYWELFAKMSNGLKAQLRSIDGKKANVSNGADADKIENAISGKDLKVTDIKKKVISKHAYPPFTTSTLQQASNNLLGYSAKKTMSMAQALYQAGYITYMRTDSVNLSSQAIDIIREKVTREYGAEYLPPKPNYYKNKARNAQEAHEAIRPAHFEVSRFEIEKSVGAMEAKLYDLIMRRAIASQMNEKKSEAMNVIYEGVGNDQKNYTFSLGGEKLIFDGYRKVWGEKLSDDSEYQEIQDIKVGEVSNCKEIEKVQNFTKPKARYTEASLVKALESYGVGRPSTYATIISTIIERGYVKKLQKNLFPQDIGMVVSDFLSKYFAQLVNYEYTANVELGLDNIAEGKVKYIPFIDKEYKPLVVELESVDKNVKKDDVVILGPSEETCPDCGASMVVRVGKYGKFLSCSTFPKCKGIKSMSGANGGMGDGENGQSEAPVFNAEKYLPADKCPKCGKDMVLKTGRYGSFWACSDYPKCKGLASLLLKEKCPECGKPLVERKGRWGKTFTGCSGYPNCRYIRNANGKSGFSKPSRFAKKGKAEAAKKSVTKKKTVKKKVAKPTVKKAKAKKAVAKK